MSLQAEVLGEPPLDVAAVDRDPDHLGVVAGVAGLVLADLVSCRVQMLLNASG